VEADHFQLIPGAFVAFIKLNDRSLLFVARFLLVLMEMINNNA
jgi:hypothetical protein